jgi:dCTP deaminase
MIMSDSQWIEWHEVDGSITPTLPPIVKPFLPEQVRTVGCKTPAISFGLSSAGYDLRLDQDWLTYLDRWLYSERAMKEAGVDHPLVDPKRFSEGTQTRIVHPTIDPSTSEVYWDMPPGSYALGLSAEYITMPRDYMGLCIGKSTYARSGLIVNTTPLEPGWCGHLVIELHNSLSKSALRVYANEGIAQLLLIGIEGHVRTSYADRKGKYQNQWRIELPKV